MPVVNVPPLAYAIEFLASAGVEEIFVFATAHAEQIEEYIKYELLFLRAVQACTSDD